VAGAIDQSEVAVVALAIVLVGRAVIASGDVVVGDPGPGVGSDQLIR
jgi:hypothetical protein